MRSFYHFAMSYRGIRDRHNNKKRLADWMFQEHDFPKQTTSYAELTDYLEFNSPFPEALSIFDELWTEYLRYEND